MHWMKILSPYRRPFRCNWHAASMLPIAFLLTACQQQWPSQPDGFRAPKVLYTTYCQSCHGPDGKNDREGALPRMRISAFLSLGDDAWLSVVGNGRGDMPAFHSRLTPTEIRSIRKFTESFCQHK